MEPTKQISIIDIVHDTMVDGPGIRTSVYSAGCENACPGCHNPETWDINKGKMMPVDDILKDILDDDLADVTFTGGDPMYQAAGFAQLAMMIKAKSKKTIWCYTGYKYETLIKRSDSKELLRFIDILVDGRYMQELRDADLLFRGSSNQRLIDVQKSIETGDVVEYDYNPFPSF